MRKFQGSRPEIRKNPKFFSPLGSPVGGSTPKTYRKTKVKISMVASGLTIDHAQPRVDRLYLLRFSRRVRLMSSDLAAAKSFTLVFVADFVHVDTLPLAGLHPVPVPTGWIARVAGFERG